MTPEEVEELISLAHDFRRWVDQGDDAAIQRARNVLSQEAERATDPELKGALRVVLAFAEGFQSPYDPPEYPGEPLAFRAWRTVERLRQEAGLQVPEEVYTRFSRINEEPNQEAEFLKAVRRLLR